MKYENDFFLKKTVIFIISDIFVYKMKIPKKWQIPLSTLRHFCTLAHSILFHTQPTFSHFITFEHTLSIQKCVKNVCKIYESVQLCKTAGTVEQLSSGTGCTKVNRCAKVCKQLHTLSHTCAHFHTLQHTFTNSSTLTHFCTLRKFSNFK